MQLVKERREEGSAKKVSQAGDTGTNTSLV